jgi:predicted nucleic acid-binding protein
MNADVVYLDSSAFVKLVIREAESTALRTWLRRRPRRASATLLRVEAVRAVMPSGPIAVRTARHQMSGMHLIDLTPTLLDEAAVLSPGLRSLDAIHLAAAWSIGADLAALLTYDARLAGAAEQLGIVVEAPA